MDTPNRFSSFFIGTHKKTMSENRVNASDSENMFLKVKIINEFEVENTTGIPKRHMSQISYSESLNNVIGWQR